MIVKPFSMDNKFLNCIKYFAVDLSLRVVSPKSKISRVGTVYLDIISSMTCRMALYCGQMKKKCCVSSTSPHVQYLFCIMFFSKQIKIQAATVCSNSSVQHLAFTVSMVIIGRD